MWTRAELKERARNVLRMNYWKAFLISLVIDIAVGGGGSGSRWANDRYSSAHNFSFESIIIIALVAIAVVLVFVFIAIALRIFVGFPLEVGGRRYFVQSAQGFDNRRCFRFAFNAGNCWGIIGTMLLKGIQNFLWFLLFIIPGIVKFYSYRMVPYILADNPNIGASKAIRLSMNMTYGHRFRMFVLDLSFLAWYLLGLLALGVGILFVMPYSNATEAELYLVLRKEALGRGMCTFNDLMLCPPQQEGYNC